jgi:hypothetical protein
MFGLFQGDPEPGAGGGFAASDEVSCLAAEALLVIVVSFITSVVKSESGAVVSACSAIV